MGSLTHMARKAVGLSLVMLLGCLTTAGQNPYVVEHIGTGEGLPNTYITGVAQDQQGVMWFTAYSKGLIRYDGFHFTTFNASAKSRPQLGNISLLDIVLDHQGRLWIAREGGLDILDPNSLEIIKDIPLPGADTCNPTINCLYVDSNGDIWASMMCQGLLRFPGGNPDRGELVERMPYISYVNRSANGQLWCMSHWEIRRQENDHFVIVPPNIFPQSHQLPFLKPIENAQGLFTGFVTSIQSTEAHLYHLNLSTNLFASGLSADAITPLVSPDISRRFLSDSSFHTPIAALAGNTLKTFEDRQGIIWASSEGAGIFKLRPREMIFTTCPDLENASLRGMLEAPDGSIFLATYSGLFQYFPQRNRARQIAPKPVEIFNLAQLNGDTMLALTDGYGAMRLDLRAPRSFYSAAGSKNEVIRYYASLSLGDGWVLAGNQQLFRLRLADWRTEPFATLPTDLSVYCYSFERTRDGRIWVGTTKGIFVISKDGQCSAPLLRKDYRLGPDSQINDIWEDSDGRLWFATRTYGVVCYDPITLRTQVFDQTTGFASNETYAIIPTNENKILWISTYSGLQCIRLADGKISLFNESDGTAGTEFNTGSYLQARTGDVYFGGVQGLTRFQPSNFKPAMAQPVAPFITGLRIEDVNSTVVTYLNYPRRDTLLQLSRGQNILEFYFGSTDYFRSATNTFYVQLVGLDQNWVPLGATPKIKYYRLPAGRYTFRVKCSDNTETNGQEIYAVSFEIDEVFYKKWWFVAFSFASGLAMIWLAFYIRSLRYKREQELRRRIATDLHDELGGSMSGISNLVQVITRRKVAGQPFDTELTRLLDLTRSAHSAMSDIIWSLDQSTRRNTRLSSRMQDYADKWLKPAGIKVVFESNVNSREKPIPFAVKHQLLMVYKELLGNALKHTFPETVQINFGINPNKSLHLSVRSTFSERKTDVPSSGRGLSIIRERIAPMGGTVEVLAEEDSFEVQIKVGKY